ncbi:L-lactate dehydrogenase [Cutibacterium acnes JCM 18909]|nr:L-lactate dehydrogenase [Cutibacterium acnes JCM 18909]
MANDKARHVRETEAEYVVAGDNSCLMNIGGVLSRQNSGVKRFTSPKSSPTLRRTDP